MISNFKSENSVGWKRFESFISFHFAYRKSNRRTKLRSFFVFITRQKQFFSKTLNFSAPNSFFPKNDKNLLFIGEFFQQASLTWNENMCERSKKIEVEDRIQKTDERAEPIYRGWISFHSMKNGKKWTHWFINSFHSFH